MAGNAPVVDIRECFSEILSMRPELTAEWQPSKKEYLRVEAEVVKLMSKVHDLERACGSLFALFVFLVVALVVIRFLF